MVVGGGLTTIIVLAAMPKEHASNAFVWTDWVNATGWSSGTAFLTGECHLARSGEYVTDSFTYAVLRHVERVCMVVVEESQRSDGFFVG